MSRDDYPYPEDEFDALGADRTPQGVHRAPLSRWRQLLPFVIVLILAPTLAFVAVRLISGGDAEDPPPPAAETTTEPATDDTPTEGEPSTTEDEPTTEDETTTDEPAADLDRSIQIWVLNGSGVSGLAADTVAVLTDDGWEDANAADYGRSQPSATTLFYDNPDQVEEAEAVADLLGITNLIESSDAADGDIVMVLRTDFELP